ncbi:MAG: polysaccharide deacetylase family protein [Lysobacterales bacterium]
MSMDPSYLEYSQRHYGMDHDRYDWSMLSERKPVAWPDGKSLALWVNVNLQFYPLNQQGKPFKVPGGMTMPYPDLRHFSLRDYGNRVGLFRVLGALDRFGIKTTLTVNSRLLERTPYLSALIKERGDEVLGHGEHMDALHYGGQDKAEEDGQISRSLNVLREATGQPVTGWMSPVRSESENTPDLLASQGIEYFCDWVNDDMPYEFRTAGRSLTAMPLPLEIEDRFVIINNLHSEASWAEQVLDSADLLEAEASQQGGRILSLNIHPWLMGQPHRIKHLEAVLENLSARSSVWSAGAGQICSAWKSQQG